MAEKLTGAIAFASGKTGDYDIWTLDTESGDLTQVTMGSFWNDKPKWSPDGQWIVFTSDRSGFPEIYKAPAIGGQPIQLTSLNRWADSPAFSPDGTRIAFISNEAGNNDIWTMDCDGQNRTQITEHGGSDDYLEWTPDGRALLWSSDRDEGDADIWRLDLESEILTQLNTDAGMDITPVPSPDGQFIAFCSNRQLVPDPDRPFTDRDKDIWLMCSDGSLPVRLTANQGADYAPCWSPDGNYLLYTASDRSTVCHLRLMDVSEVLTAYRSGDPEQVEKAAADLREDTVEVDRTELKADIDAKRRTTLITSWMPDSWVSSCYPSGYFGLERNPHWTAATIGSAVLST